MQGRNDVRNGMSGAVHGGRLAPATFSRSLCVLIIL